MQTMEQMTMPRRHRMVARVSTPRRTSSESSDQEVRQQAAQQTRQGEGEPVRRRVVRRPQQEIPKVVYTRPKPLYPGRFLLRLATVLGAVTALMLCLSTAFRVDTVLVSGTGRYTPWMIQEAGDIHIGESLLGMNKDQVAGKILSELPYVNALRIRVQLPGTIRIEIEEMDVAYGVQDGDGTWWLVSGGGRALEQVHPANLEGHPKLLGVTIAPTSGGAQVQGWQEPQPSQPVEPSTPVESQPAEPTEQPQPTEPAASEPVEPTQPPVTSDQQLEVALSIAQALEECSVIGRIDGVDVTDLQELAIEYDGRIRVLLGDSSELSYKIRYMAQALRQLEDYETGVLDVSLRYYDQALFDPQTGEQ